MGIQKYFAIYSYHGGGVRGFKRCYDTFSQVDIFDFKRMFINTRENIRDGYSDSDYMFYAPVYSEVLEEMIYVAHDYWASAIRYTNYSMKTVYIDLGCGSGKTLISAHESKRFDNVYGVELLTSLADRCNQNITRVTRRNDTNKPLVYNLNVEDPAWADHIISEASDPTNLTLFIFNKNSYSSKVVQKTLDIAQSYFKNIVYLYQNPVGEKVLDENHFECFATDSKPPTAHKNFKYKLFIKQLKAN